VFAAVGRLPVLQRARKRSNGERCRAGSAWSGRAPRMRPAYGDGTCTVPYWPCISSVVAMIHPYPAHLPSGLRSPISDRTGTAPVIDPQAGIGVQPTVSTRPG